MVEGHDPLSSGWGRVSEGRAWLSRTRSSGTGDFSVNTAAESASQAQARLRGSSALARLPNSFAQEWNALGREKDPELFFAGLFALGKRLERAGRLDAALELYFTLPAQERPDALQGKASFGSRAELLIDHFSDQATHPASLISLLAGSLAFQTTRLSVLKGLLQSPARGFWTSNLGARLAAGTAAFFVEVPVFSLSGNLAADLLGEPVSWDPNSLGRKMASAALVLGPMRLVGASVGRGLDKGGLNPKLQAWARQSALFGGILLGQRLVIAAGLCAPKDASSMISDGLATLLHVQIAGRLTHGILGAGHSALNREPEGRFRRPIWDGSWGDMGFSLQAASPAKIQISQMSSLEKGNPEMPTAQRLRDQYLPQFPPEGEHSFSKEILATALKIPIPFPKFQERLLESLVQGQDKGSLAQFHRVLALEEVFKANSLNTPTGSWDYSLIQLWLEQALAEENPRRRRETLRDFYSLMDRGLSREGIQELFQRYGYGKELAAFPTPNHGHFEKFFLQHWSHANQLWRDISGGGYPGEFRPMLLHFVYYYSQGRGVSPETLIKILAGARGSENYPLPLIDKVLKYAKAHPQGLLVLQRMFQVFAVGDLPLKLQEIVASSATDDWLGLSQGIAPESAEWGHRAQEIDGTAYTAYLKDEGLARRVLSIAHQGVPFARNPVSREPSHLKFLQGFWRWARSGTRLGPLEMMNLLELNSSADTQAMIFSWMLKKFSLEVLSDQDFESWVNRAGLYSPCHVSLFILGRKPGQMDRILIREMPPFDLESPEGQDEAFHQLLQRLDGANHEFEHWRSFRGMEERDPRDQVRINLVNISREDRIKSEILAYMAEVAWRLRHLSAPFIDVARLLNQPLALYLRNVADTSYFSRENQEKLAALQK